MQSALEVQKIRFSGNLIFDDNGTLIEQFWDHDSPKYTGEPSDELDARWKDLFRGELGLSTSLNTSACTY